MEELFKFEKTYIEGLYVINNIYNRDNIFFYDKKTFFRNGLNIEFIQDNESYSKRNVLRGLHIQIKKPQGKLVHVLKGKIQDVAVDLRRESSTFGKWHSEILSDDNNKSLYIPEGFAHGFITLSDYAKVQYKVSNYWNLDDETGIPWDDKYLDIKWEIDEGSPIIAKKDLNYVSFLDNENFK